MDSNLVEVWAIVILGICLIVWLLVFLRRFCADLMWKHLLTRKELLKSIPPTCFVHEYNFVPSTRPASTPLSIGLFDPSSAVLAVSSSEADSRRLFEPMLPPASYMISSNRECDRTVIYAVNQLLSHSEDPTLQRWSFSQRPLLTTSGRDGELVQEAGDPDYEARKVQKKEGRLHFDGNKSVATITEKHPRVAGGYQQGQALPDTIKLYQNQSSGGNSFANAVQQEYRYMETRKQPFGLLTFLLFYVLLYHDGLGRLWMTRAIPYDQKKPTIIEIIYYMVVENVKYKETELWPPVPHQVSAVIPSQPTRTASAMRAAPADRKTRGEKQPAIFSDSQAAKLRMSDFDIRKILGPGRSGLVYQGSFEGFPAAIKVVDSERRGAEELLNDLATEHAVYHRLQPLWGSDVPRVLGYGMCADQPFQVLVLELIDGTFLDASFPKSVRQSAVEALRRIHRWGVLHGDIRSENILVTRDRAQQVVFLDFGFARTDSNRQEREDELNDLKEMLED